MSLRGCRGIKAPCVSRLEAGRKGGDQWTVNLLLIAERLGVRDVGINYYN